MSVSFAAAAVADCMQCHVFDCRNRSNQVLASVGQAFTTTGAAPPLPAEYADVINPADRHYAQYEFRRNQMMDIEGASRGAYETIERRPGCTAAMLRLQ